MSDRRTTLLAIKERPAFLLALLCTSPTLTQTEMESLTAWSPNTVSKSVAVLKSHGLAVQGRERGPWAATLAGKALFDSNDSSTVEGSWNLGPVGPLGLPDNFTAIGNQPRLHLQNEPRSISRSRFGDSSTVEGSIPHGVRNRTGLPSPIEGSNGHSSIGEGTNLGSIPQPLRNGKNGHGPNLPNLDWIQADPRRVLRLAACRLVGINAPKLNAIVSNDDIDPIFVLAHDIQIRIQNKKRDPGRQLNSGAMIWRIENFQSVSKEASYQAECMIAELYRQCGECGLGYFLNDHGGYGASEDQPCPHCGFGDQAEAEERIPENDDLHPSE